jgi:hypothetical protein
VAVGYQHVQHHQACLGADEGGGCVWSGFSLPLGRGWSLCWRQHRRKAKDQYTSIYLSMTASGITPLTV